MTEIIIGDVREIGDIGKFQTIVADPPWWYADQRKVRRDGKTPTRGIGACHHYGQLKTPEICGLEIAKLAANRCHLFLWTTCPLLSDALRVMAAWKFKFCTVAFSWTKINKGLWRMPRGHLARMLITTGLPSFLAKLGFFGPGFYTGCLGGETTVYLLHVCTGTVQLRSLAELWKLQDCFENLRIWSHTGWHKIKGMARHFSEDVLRIRTDLGTMVVTPEHRFPYKRTIREELGRIDGHRPRRNAHRIQYGTISKILELKTKEKRNGVNLLFSTKSVERATPLNTLGPLELTDELAWAAGLFCAEGNYDPNAVRYSLSIKEVEIAQRLTQWVEKLGLFSRRYKSRPVRVRTYDMEYQNGKVCVISCIEIREAFGQLILGKGTHGKRLNLPLLLQTSTSFRKAFLQGMLDGDGFLAQGKYVRMTLCNKELVKDFQKLAHSIGQPCRTRSQMSGSGGFRGYPAMEYTLSFCYPRLKAKLELNEQQVLPVTILGWEPIEPCDVYDISVEGELFVGGDIISHNSNVELVLLGRKGKPFPHARGHKASQIVFTPVQGHSQKPEEIQNRIESTWPDATPRLELFARRPRPGWTVHGLEADGRGREEEPWTLGF